MALNESIAKITNIIYKRKAILVSFAEVTHFSKTSGEIHYKIIKNLINDPRNNIKFICSENVSFTASILMNDYVTGKTDIYPTNNASYGLIDRKLYEFIRKYNMKNKDKIINIKGIERELVSAAIIPVSNPSKKLVDYYDKFKSLNKQTWEEFGKEGIPEGLNKEEKKAAKLLVNSITKDRFDIMYNHLLKLTKKGTTIYVGYHVNHKESLIFDKLYGKKFISFGLAAKKIQHPKIINIPYYTYEFETYKKEILQLFPTNIYNMPLNPQYVDKLWPLSKLEQNAKNYQLINTIKSKGNIRLTGNFKPIWKDPSYTNVNIYDYVMVIPNSKAKLTLY